MEQDGYVTKITQARQWGLGYAFSPDGQRVKFDPSAGQYLERIEHFNQLFQDGIELVGVTKAGFYRQIPAPSNGKLDRRNATLADYLRRLALQVALFQNDVQLEGISVSSQACMTAFEIASRRMKSAVIWGCRLCE
jgi:hypothetical protein